MNSSTLIVWLIPIGFLVFMMWQQSRQRKRQLEMVEALVPGDRIVTVGGVIGTVREVEADIVRLEVGDGVVLTIVKGAISGRVDEDGK